MPLAAADNVTIRSGAILYVDGTYSCTNLTVSSNATAGTLKMNAGSQLTCTGTLDMGGTGATSFGTLDMTLGGKFIMAGNLFNNTVNDVFTPGLGTFAVTGNPLTFPAGFSAFNNLEVSLAAANTLTLGGNTTCSGYLNILSGTLHTNAASNFNLTVSGAFTVATGATFRANASTVTCNAAFNLSGTSTIGTGTMLFKGNFVNNGTYTIGTGNSQFGGTTVISAYIG